MSSFDAATHPELAETIALIKNRPRTITLQDLADQAKVSVSWLTQLVNENIKDPSFNKVMRIRDCLLKLDSKPQVP